MPSDFASFDEPHEEGELRVTQIMSERDVPATIAREDEFPPGTIIADRYHVLDKIAEGGMGLVLRVFDSVVHRQCALKLLRREHAEDAEMLRRFQWEVRINGRLQHPGIVPIHEVRTEGPEPPFFTMHLIEGRTFALLLQERTSLDSDLMKLLHVFQRICQAVAYAHSCNIVHRDIKPQNIMVADLGVVKVMDWGLAKSMCPEDFSVPDDVLLKSGFHESWRRRPQEETPNPSNTMTGAVVGTLSYVAPEQIRGEADSCDPRLDVFCLGGVLCEILTGQPTYQGRSLKRLFRLASRAETDDAELRLKMCSAERSLKDLALACLQVDPRNRPANASEINDAISSYIESDLRRAERELVRFFDLSLELFCIAGLDGYFRRLNGNFERVLGYSSEELRAAPFTDFVHPEDIQSTVAAVETLTGGEPVAQFTNRYRHRDGHYVVLEWTSRSVPEEGVIYAVARPKAAE